jgi:hypothetical protein
MTTTKGFSVRQFFVSAVVASAAIGAFAGIAAADSRLGVSVDVGASGGTLVRGAEVTAVSDSEVRAETSWGDAVLNWVVKTDAETDYVGKNGKDMARGDIAVGDTISFRGSLDQAVSGLAVTANVVKNWSKTEARTKLNGTVSSINSSLGSFVVTHGNSTTTIETNGSTDFEVNGKDGSLADLFLNSKVKIQGMFNASSTIFAASSVEIASSAKKHGWDKDDNRAWRDWIRSKIWQKIGTDD